MNDLDVVRRELVDLLDGVGAHMTFEDAVADFPDDAINRRPPDVAYTPWHLVEHLRLTQSDILDYIVNRNYVPLGWPEEHWPAPDATATPADFAASVDGFLADRATLRGIVTEPSTDLFAAIPDTPGHTIVREIRVVSDHNAYHVGEFAILRQVMGTWPAGRVG
jgi:hypothetical protein